ncbi:MAG: DUF1598 domain-containing protein, partial [Planctomycetia bacterium]
KDVLLIGPGEGWRRAPDGRAVGRSSGRPTLNLDDVAVALRCVLDGEGEARCSIDATTAGLAAMEERRRKPLVAKTRGEAEAVRAEYAEILGNQRVTTGGVPEGSRFALAMIEADYIMKRLAMGAEKFAGLTSYHDALVEMTEQNNFRPNLARWWFTPDYDRFVQNEDGTLIEIRGPGLKLLNEEEFVDADGRRTRSGRAGGGGDKYADSFNERRAALEEKIPAFADLRNLFDLMIAVALVKEQGKAEWLDGLALRDEAIYEIPLAKQPQWAATVASVRLHGRGGKFVTVGYGGVSMRPGAALAGLTPQVDAGRLASIPFGPSAAAPGSTTPGASTGGTGTGSPGSDAATLAKAAGPTPADEAASWYRNLKLTAAD